LVIFFVTGVNNFVDNFFNFFQILVKNGTWFWHTPCNNPPSHCVVPHGFCSRKVLFFFEYQITFAKKNVINFFRHCTVFQQRKKSCVAAPFYTHSLAANRKTIAILPGRSKRTGKIPLFPAFASCDGDKYLYLLRLLHATGQITSICLRRTMRRGQTPLFASVRTMRLDKLPLFASVAPCDGRNYLYLPPSHHATGQIMSLNR
jgi:hypothetical protein